MELNDIVKKSMITSHFLKVVMIILLFIAIWNNNWTGVFGCVLGIFLSIIPSVLKRNYSITLPWFLDLLIAFPGQALQ